MNTFVPNDFVRTFSTSTSPVSVERRLQVQEKRLEKDRAVAKSFPGVATQIFNGVEEYVVAGIWKEKNAKLDFCFDPAQSGRYKVRAKVTKKVRAGNEYPEVTVYDKQSFFLNHKELLEILNGVRKPKIEDWYGTEGAK